MSKGMDMREYSGRLRSRAGHNYSDIDIEYMLRVSIPRYESSRPRDSIHGGVLATRDTGGAPCRISSEIVEDVEAIAFKNFVEEEPKILLRTIARGITKYLAFRTMKKKQGEVAGLLVNVFNIATESADTRSWLTLPNSFGMSRTPLPPGKYNLHLSFPR